MHADLVVDDQLFAQADKTVDWNGEISIVSTFSV
jgi:hypothetical protein